MSIENKTMHVTPVGGNIFVDLGFEPGEAKVLKEKSDRRIALKLQAVPSGGNENHEGTPPSEGKE